MHIVHDCFVSCVITNPMFVCAWCMIIIRSMLPILSHWGQGLVLLYHKVNFASVHLFVVDPIALLILETLPLLCRLFIEPVASNLAVQ